jgi:hypothetical protein
VKPPLRIPKPGRFMERAVTWIFSHEESSFGNGVEATVEKVDEGSAEYEMFAFVSHKGTSTGCGHYVAHEWGKEGWVLMNRLWECLRVWLKRVSGRDMFTFIDEFKGINLRSFPNFY